MAKVQRVCRWTGRAIGLDLHRDFYEIAICDEGVALSPGARAPVFCTLAGGRLDTSYVRQLLLRLARKAGIQKRTHAHGLRHTTPPSSRASTPRSMSSAMRSGHQRLWSPTATSATSRRWS